MLRIKKRVRYYPFPLDLDLFTGICNALNDTSGTICAPNTIEDVNLSLFDMIAGINESKPLSYKTCILQI